MYTKVINRCRVCKASNLIPVLSLGVQAVVNFTDSTQKESYDAPLDLVLCSSNRGGCGLLQLRHTFNHDLLYKKYWYKSGISTDMVLALRNVVEKTQKIMPLKKGDLVIDIGANDGTLLGQYKASNITKVGFEPSNLWKLGVRKNTKIINDYFNFRAFNKSFNGRKAKIITSIAMFYDLPDPNKFVEDIKSCLDKNGIWVIQMNYLGLMLKNNTFDNISHEHLEYYSLLSLENLLKRHDMQVIDAELNDVNGGSFRVYVKNKDANVKPVPNYNVRLQKIRRMENQMKLNSEAPYRSFKNRIVQMRKKTINFLKSEKRKGKKIYIYGASTRGLVVLQFFGINKDLIEFAVDKNPDKEGKYIANTGIRIISIDKYRKDMPDYMFVLPYHFINEIKKQESGFLAKGGKLIVAIPKLTIISKKS